MSQSTANKGNVRLLNRLTKAKEQPFRSFKIRYLLYSLPFILVVSGLMTIILASFASASLDQQCRQQVGSVIEDSAEELRMIILSRNSKDLQEFLQRLAGKVNSNSIILTNPLNEKFGAFVEQKSDDSEYSLIYTHVLLMQSIAEAAEEWRLKINIKPSPLFSLIDNFLIYQLLIIAVMILGSIIGMFMAFEKSVNKPIKKLLDVLRAGLLDEGIATFPEIVENDEFGELALLIEEMLVRTKQGIHRFNLFSSQVGVACFNLDYKDETFDFHADPSVVIEQPGVVIRKLNDFWPLISADQRGEAKQAWFDLKEMMLSQQNGIYQMELRVLSPKEDYSAPTDELWVKLVIVWSTSGDIPEIQGYLSNVTADKRREVDFSTQAERYRKIYENLPVGIWRSQSDKFIAMNQAMAEIIGYATAEEAIDDIASITHDLYVSPVDRTFFFDELKKRDQVKNLEMKFRRKNGEIFWGALFGRLYLERNEQLVEGAFVDITQKKQAEDRLRADEEFMRQTLETAGIVSWQIDTIVGNIIMKGPITKLLGNGSDNIMTLKEFCRLVHSNDMQSFNETIEKVKRSEATAARDCSQITFRICRQTLGQKTEIRWLQAFLKVADPGSMNRLGLVRGLFIDITDLKRGEEDLKLAIDKSRHENQEKLQFFANISHDVRTPLNAIIGFSELLAPLLLAGKGEHYIGSILAASRNLITIVDDILDLARLETGKVELVCEPLRIADLTKDIKQFFSAAAEKKQLELIVVTDGEVPPLLLLDEGRIRQVLVSLLSNAIKFTDEGAVALKFSLTHSLQKAMVNLLITIEDSGIGIPESELDKFFDPFAIKKGKGNRTCSAGINLAICARLVKLMNGTIKVKSDVERGTRFEILLRDVPVVAGQHRSKAVVGRQLRDYSFKAQKVLVADDTASNRELLTEALANTGLKIVAVADGNEAVAKAKTELPDLIFMDIRMPGKDGICAARELKCFAATAAIPIVAVTASVSFTEEAKLKGFFDGFLSKPISLAKLFAEAAKFLDHDYNDSNIEKAPGFSLPPEAFEQLSEPWVLREAIVNEIIPLLDDMEGAIVVENVKGFANFLKSVAVKHSFNSLALEAEKLVNKAEAFDIAGVRECSARIRAILLQLLKVYSRVAT